MKKILLLAVLIPVTTLGVAQLRYDRADFENINRAYAQLGSLQTEVDYNYYPNHYTATAGESLRAVFSMQGKNVHYRLGSVETLATGDMTLLVDHEEKQILIDRGRQNVQQMLFGADLDTLLGLCTSIRASTPEPGVKKYELVAELSETERMDIYFDVRTYLIRRVVLFYSDELPMERGGTGEKPRLELVYRRQDTNPVFRQGLFSTARFIKKSGNGFVPAAAYKGFEIFNALK